jgi:hypothetical protein
MSNAAPDAKGRPAMAGERTKRAGSCRPAGPPGRAARGDGYMDLPVAW